MSRQDLLGLTEEALIDLTSRGVVRRASRELTEQAVHLTVSEQDGVVIVTGDDGTSCTIPNGPIEDWLCSCTAGSGCRHVIRAVLAYQQQAPTAGPGQAEAQPSLTDPDGENDEPDLFDPAMVDDAAVAEVLSASALTAARRQARGGVIGQVREVRSGCAVQLLHPVGVTVRFLAQTDLRHARCTCPAPDPCHHVALAVLAARGDPHGDTGLRVNGQQQWSPPRTALQQIEAELCSLVQVGIDAGHARLLAPWRRLTEQLNGAELYNLAEVTGEIADQMERYGARSNTYDPQRLLNLVAELTARWTSLTQCAAGRVPDRLVAGSRRDRGRVGRSRLIGLGTEALRLDDGWRLVAHVVDTRAGTAMRATARARPAVPHGTTPLAGVPIATWGAGKVVMDSGTLDSQGDFRPGKGQATGSGEPGLAELDLPWRATSFHELLQNHDQLPQLLDTRRAGIGIGACRISGVSHVRALGPGQVQARLMDETGRYATLTSATREGQGAAALMAQLEGWQATPPSEIWVSGRWDQTSGRITVDPFLVVGLGVALQPHLAHGSGSTDNNSPPRDPAHLAMDQPTAQRARAAATLIQELDETLSVTLVAGLDRLTGRDPRWSELAHLARTLGARRMANLADLVATQGQPQAVLGLSVVSATGRPMVRG